MLKLIFYAIVFSFNAKAQTPIEDVHELIDTLRFLPAITEHASSLNSIGCTTPANEPDSNAAKRLVTAARKVLGTVYQSCQAVELIVDHNTPQIKELPRQQGVLVSDQDLKNYIQGHYVLSHIKEKNKQCTDALSPPPIYALGAKPKVHQGEIELLSYDLSQPGCLDLWCPAKGCSGNGVSCESVPVRGMDCSGFLAATFAVAGYKFSTDRNIQYSSPFFGGTTLINTLSQLKSSCLQRQDADQFMALQSGDIINMAGSPGHVVMIENLGPDPLGQMKKNCLEIGINDLDFSFLQSGQPWGVSRVHINSYRKKKILPLWIKNLIKFAQEACLDKKTQNNQSRQISESFSILRHVGDTKVGCIEKSLKLENEECLGPCLSQL